jgi:hypothetical protein
MFTVKYVHIYYSSFPILNSLFPNIPPTQLHVFFCLFFFFSKPLSAGMSTHTCIDMGPFTETQETLQDDPCYPGNTSVQNLLLSKAERSPSMVGLGPAWSCEGLEQGTTVLWIDGCDNNHVMSRRQYSLRFLLSLQLLHSSLSSPPMFPVPWWRKG